jgi:exopolysaccharide production protein ExoQ
MLWLVLLLGLLYFDPAKEPRTSPALWVPAIWMFIVASRLPSQWLGVQVGSAAQAFEEGNPIDRAIYSILILLAMGILLSRSFHWGNLFAQNLALIALLVFALVSVVWSDFAFVAFKRWFRHLGDYLVILVVVSDAHPMEATRTLLRRLCYLLIPLSIVLIKYYPGIGTSYDVWTGAVDYAGVTTGKNLLGVAFLVNGIFFFWDTVTRWQDRKERRTKRILAVNFAFLGMTLWLLNLTDSATSRVCLVIGCLVILAARSNWARRYPSFLKAAIPAGFIIYLILAFGFDLNGQLASQVGRNGSLTGRTEIWAAVLSMHTNPLIGTGYESFWLGDRLSRLWPIIGHINEAHNGYLEVYLNLGLVGDFLLCLFLIASYRSIWRRAASSSTITSLALALWTTTLFHNMTESSAFKGQLLWLVFLLVVIVVSVRTPSAREGHPFKQHKPEQSPVDLREGVAV